MIQNIHLVIRAIVTQLSERIAGFILLTKMIPVSSIIYMGRKRLQRITSLSASR
ncbi:MAG: hypothetical protein HOP10_15705 [Chitinophagaceae bacterium]|nr:hypothetical protein [Chitinophagaceae bacterium]